MRFLAQIVFAGCCVVALGVSFSMSAAEKAAEDIKFKELYDLLRANLNGADEAELNRAAVQGLLKELRGRAVLAGDKSSDGAAGDAAPLGSTAVFDKHYAYLRVARVEAGLDEKFSNALQKLRATNKLKGLVLDLRFATGDDYAAAAAAAEMFFAKEQPLIDWGDGVRRSKAKTDAVAQPVAVLINHQTTGAAEAFAAILREGDIGLLIGTNTAGAAHIGKEFALKTGQRLRIATAPVTVGDGHALGVEGLKPDIHVDVSAMDEKIYFDDAYKMLPKAAGAPSSSSLSVTNRPRRRLTEADLVRMQREGQSPDDLTNTVARDTVTTPPVVNDPALARAIDLLKGLSVVKQFRAL